MTKVLDDVLAANEAYVLGFNKGSPHCHPRAALRY
jgi:hypothetical protein